MCEYNEMESDHLSLFTTSKSFGFQWEGSILPKSLKKKNLVITCTFRFTEVCGGAWFMFWKVYSFPVIIHFLVYITSSPAQKQNQTGTLNREELNLIALHVIPSQQGMEWTK